MSADTPAKEQDKFVLRLPDGMRDRIAEEAKTNNRSMNAEIIGRLQESLDRPPDADILTASKFMRKYNDTHYKASLWYIYNMLLEISNIPGADIVGILTRMRDASRQDLSEMISNSDQLIEALTEISQIRGDKDLVGHKSLQAITSAIEEDLSKKPRNLDL